MYSSFHDYECVVYVRMHVHLMYVHRFIVRDFEYDPKAVKAERDTKKRLQDELKKQFVSDAVLRTYF